MEVFVVEYLQQQQKKSYVCWNNKEQWSGTTTTVNNVWMEEEKRSEPRISIGDEMFLLQYSRQIFWVNFVCVIIIITLCSYWQ
jgi:hypothetical protein